MKKLAFILILSLVFLAAECQQPEPIVFDCGEQIDSLNKYWVDVVKNIECRDTIFTYIDSVSIRYKDSVSIRYIDSLIVKDSTVVDTILVAPVETVEILPIEVKVDSVMEWQTLNEAAGNLTDEFIFVDRNIDTGTRWAVEGYPHAAMFYFDTLYVITEIWVNTFAWNEGYTHQINLYFYGSKIDSIETKMELWSKHKIFYVGDHLYIDVVGGKNSYSDLGGIRIFGYKRN